MKPAAQAEPITPATLGPMACMSRKLEVKNELGFICLSGLATGASWLCYYKALQLGPASLVAPIDKLSILVTVLFSYIVFHERLSRKALTGLAVLVAGTLVMLA